MDLAGGWQSLPEPWRQPIGRLAGVLAGRVLGATAGALSKAVTGDSLTQVMRTAIATLVSRFPARDDVDWSVLERFFGDAGVAEEIAKMFKTVRERPDPGRLADLLVDAGLEPRTLPDFEVRDTVRGFIRACRDAALSFADLRDVMRTRALLVLSRDDEVPSLGELRRAYLQELHRRHEWLDFAGILQMRNIVRLRLDDVFVPLAATREWPEGDAVTRPSARTLRGRGGPEGLAGSGEADAVERRVTLVDALAHPKLVILGEPGSGKSTLLKHVALRLAQGLGDDLGLDDGPQARLPILLSVASYATALRQRERALDEYAAEYYEARAVRGLAPLFADALERGRAIVLLDGLDEVQDTGERTRVMRLVRDFVGVESRRGNRFVVTSRIASYEAARLTDFEHVTVLPFRDEDIEQFARRWCLAFERAVPGAAGGTEASAARQAEALIADVRASDSVRALATNPLLLTIIALIHHQNVRLPERRVELYRLAVEALAESWNRARNLDGQSAEMRLGDRRLDATFVVNTLGPLALWVHGHRPGDLVERREVEAHLAEILREQERVGEARAREMAHELLDLVRRGSGLLQERGLGLYGFLHLTFEEYLAARAIADLSPDPAAAVLEHWANPGWHEVVLLTVGACRRRDATQVVAALLEVPGAAEPRGGGVVLAGRALADAGRGAVEGAVWERAVTALVRLVEERGEPRASLKMRVDAADVLGVLGDPGFKADDWEMVRGGEFLMGSRTDEVRPLVQRFGREWEDFFNQETPQRRIDVKAFSIGRHPVTNGEFKRFIDAGGYATRECWSDEGWRWLHRSPAEEKEIPEWRRRAERTQPAFWSHPVLGSRKPTRPVVGVTWHEAGAYSRWLTAKLSGDGVLDAGHVVRLPTEAEWEKAARGSDGRWWPWGNEWGPEKANTAEQGPKTTTPVGLYPGGASPCGARDMAGNVWEWTSSLYRPYPYMPDDGREDPTADGPRCLRGGSFLYTADYARSAYRAGFPPDDAGGPVGFRCVVAPPSPPPR